MKKKATKQALLMSVMSLLLCVSMLVGTTFAWFTDSVTSANNIIKSGNLNVVLEYWNGTEWVDVEGKSDILTNELWEPGVTEIAYLRIANAGSLALKYQLGINIVSETEGVNKAGNNFKLSNYIEFGVIEDINGETDAYDKDAAGRTEAISDIETAKKLNEGYGKGAMMEAGDMQYFALVVYMPTYIDNVANHDGLHIPKIDLGINVLAMQVEFEKDSFDEFYDDLAIYSDGGHRLLSANLEADATTGSEVALSNETETFKVKAKAGAEGKVAVSVALEASKIDYEREKNILSYDIKVTGQEPGSDVEVQIYIGKQLTGVLVYHEGNLMNRSQYSYDPISGYVTITTAEFSIYDIEFDRSFINIYDDINDIKGTSGAHIVGQNFESTDYIFFGNGTENVVFLNDYTITAGNPGQYLFVVQQGGILQLTGNGTIHAGKGFYSNKGNAQFIIDGGTYNMTVTGTLNNIKHHSVAQNDSKIVINGGTFTSNVADACLFFATTNSRIEINGGFFENTATKTPDLFSMGTNKYNTNRIVITGGTFVNWNPLNDRMCYTGQWPANGEAAFGGPWMLIPGGYTVISEAQANGDVWYSVVPVESAG